MIEIEKKFLLTKEQQRRLLDNAQELGSAVVEDSYFDTDTFGITLKDLWFRERDGMYELKVPLKSGTGSHTTNRYHEITDVKEIARELGLSGEGDFETKLKDAGIKKFITCFTRRASYEKQGFHIDIDAATYLDSPFIYALAEIELLINSESEADEAEQRIVEFAQSMGIATDVVVTGKIAAYLEAEKPEHFKALVDAGVLRLA